MGVLAHSVVREVTVLYNSQVLKKGELVSFLWVLAGVVSKLCGGGLFRDGGGGANQVCLASHTAKDKIVF